MHQGSPGSCARVHRGPSYPPEGLRLQSVPNLDNPLGLNLGARACTSMNSRIPNCRNCDRLSSSRTRAYSLPVHPRIVRLQIHPQAAAGSAPRARAQRSFEFRGVAV
jgi:hypothetical protein